MCFLISDKRVQAIGDYSQAISLEPENATIWYNRGNAHSETGDLERALADYKQAIELDPNYEDTLIDKGFAWLNVGANRFGRFWRSLSS